MGIFQSGSPIVSVKKSTIFSSVFFIKIGLKVMISYGLEKKKAFGDNKNLSFFKSKKWVFYPWFRSKSWQFFLVSFSAK